MISARKFSSDIENLIIWHIVSEITLNIMRIKLYKLFKLI